MNSTSTHTPHTHSHTLSYSLTLSHSQQGSELVVSVAQQIRTELHRSLHRTGSDLPRIGVLPVGFLDRSHLLREGNPLQLPPQGIFTSLHFIADVTPARNGRCRRPPFPPFVSVDIYFCIPLSLTSTILGMPSCIEILSQTTI